MNGAHKNATHRLVHVHTISLGNSLRYILKSFVC